MCSKEIKEISGRLLTPGYGYIDTVGSDEDEQTHKHVLQQFMSIAQGQTIKAIHHIITGEAAAAGITGSMKIMVFLPTAKQTSYMANLFTQVMTFPNVNILEIHSGKSQSSRISTSEKFRSAKSAILFTSDVTARGLDYPDVTLGNS